MKAIQSIREFKENELWVIEEIGGLGLAILSVQSQAAINSVRSFNKALMELINVEEEWYNAIKELRAKKCKDWERGEWLK